MRRPLFFAALVLLTATLHGALPHGQAFTPTDTRYGTVFGYGARFATLGTNTFLFWGDNALRVTKVTPGEKRVGRPIVTEPQIHAQFDGVWTGSYYLAVFGSGDKVHGLLLDAEAEPVGGAFPIVDAAIPASPRIARAGSSLYLFYRSPELTMLELSPAGRILGQAKKLTTMEVDRFAIASHANGFGAVLASSHGVSALVLDAEARPIAEKMLRPLADGDSAVPAMATNGRGYLAVWSSGGQESEITAAMVGLDGSAGRDLAIAPSRAGSPVAAWNGSGYTIAYTDYGASQGVDARVDERAEVLLTVEPVAGAADVHALSVIDGRVKLIASAPAYGILTADVGTSIAVDAPLVYGAADQTPFASASSSLGTLLVWREILDGQQTFHVGLRLRDGRWSERVLHGVVGVPLAAASNGQEFVILTGTDEAGHYALLRLDRDARLLGATPVTGFIPQAIAWNGTTYAVAGYGRSPRWQDIVVAPFSASGTFGAPVRAAVGGYNDPIRIASDGRGFLVIWEEHHIAMFPPASDFHTVRARALGADLQPLQAEPLTLAQYEAKWPAVTWDGTNYLVAWAFEGLFISTTRISADGTMATPVQPLFRGTPMSNIESLALATSGGSIGLAWSDLDRGETTVALVRSAAYGSWIEQSVTFSKESYLPPLPLVSLSSGGFAMFAQQFRTAPPHHGASRVVMRAFRPSLPPLPEAPEVTVERFNGQLRVRWTAPAQTVAGYRVEYRIGDGSWNESGRWFDADERVAPWPWVRSGVTYAFRGRAFNDSGAGAYSAPVEIQASVRRRAVR